MKSGQCPKCGSHEVFSNTNRKFPALNTITIATKTSGNRYASLDTYICVTCGYVESYVAKPEDLSYIKQEWASVRETCDRAVVNNGSNHVPSKPDDELTSQAT